MKKPGKLSNDEMEFIRQNVGEMTDEAIAVHLNRQPALIARYRAQIPAKREVYAGNDEKDLKSELYALYFWPELRNQLTQPELTYFINSWTALAAQFKEQGIQTTDHIMMRDLILLEIMVNRNLREQHNIGIQMSDLDRLITKGMQSEHRNTSQESVWQRELNGLREADLSITKALKELLLRKDAKLEQLRATRDQRFKSVEESNKNIFELIKFLNDKRNRAAEGRRNELCKLCVVAERQRLGATYKYEDDQYDMPFLTPETIIGEPNELSDDEEETNSQ